MINEVTSEWLKWPLSMHDESKQLDRAGRIESVVIKTINIEEGFMECCGSNDEVYQTSLTSCTCRDFIINQKKNAPCKHMYKLAFECGFGVNTEYGKIKSQILTRLNLMDVEKLNKVMTFIETPEKTKNSKFLLGFVIGAISMTIWLSLNILINNIR